MKKRFFAVILALALCLSLVVSAAAAEGEIFVIDELDYLYQDEVDQLNKMAQIIWKEKNIGLFFVFTTEDALMDYNVASLVGGMEDYFVMLENETSWYATAGGKGKAVLGDKVQELREIYDATDTYVAGVEEFLRAAAEYFPKAEATAPDVILTPGAIPTPGTIPADTTDVAARLLYDEADLLEAAQEAKLIQQLSALSRKHNAQVVVYTVDAIDTDVDRYLNELYDVMGFGYGEDKDGVLLLVCMNPRQWRILSNGYAGQAITGSEISAIGDEMVSDLSDGDYARAFDIFVAQTDYYLDGYLNGFPFAFGTNLMICLVIGLVVGLIVTAILKGQLKSVRQQKTANSYVKPGSMYLTMQNDFFLYRHVSRTRKESSSSSGSSGGGSSRSTGGGSF